MEKKKSLLLKIYQVSNSFAQDFDARRDQMGPQN